MTTTSIRTSRQRRAPLAHLRLLVAALAALALLASGCADDDATTDAGNAAESGATASDSDAADGGSDDAADEDPAADDAASEEEETTTTAVADEPAMDLTDAAVVTVTEQGAEPRVELRLQLEPGQTETMIMNQVQELSQSIGGQAGPDVGAIGMIIEQELTSAAAGDGLIEISSIVTSVAVDENTDPLIAGELQTALDDMTGITTNSIVDDRGRVLGTEIDGLDAIDPTIADTMDQLTSNSQFAHPLPEEAVGVGAKWEVSQILQLNGLDVEQITTYEVLSIDGSVVELALASEQLVEPGDELVANGASATVVLWEGVSSASVTYDLTSMVPTSEAQVFANQEFEFGPGAEKTLLEQSIQTTLTVSRG